MSIVPSRSPRIGIAGAGPVTDAWLPALKSAGGVPVVGVCDPDDRAATDLYAREGIAPRDTLAALVDTSDILFVGAQAADHLEMGRRIVEAGRSRPMVILLPQPLVRGHEVDEFQELAHREGVCIVPASDLAYGAVPCVAEAISRIGQISSVEASYELVGAVPGWMAWLNGTTSPAPALMPALVEAVLRMTGLQPVSAGATIERKAISGEDPAPAIGLLAEITLDHERQIPCLATVRAGAVADRLSVRINASHGRAMVRSTRDGALEPKLWWRESTGIWSTTPVAAPPGWSQPDQGQFRWPALSEARERLVADVVAHVLAAWKGTGSEAVLPTLQEAIGASLVLHVATQNALDREATTVRP